MYESGSHTELGVRVTVHAWIVILLHQVIYLMVWVTGFALIASSPLDPAANDTLLKLAGLTSALVLVTAVAIILGLTGLVALYVGRNEFGTEHARNINRATVAILLATPVSLVVGAISTAAGGIASGIVYLVTAPPLFLLIGLSEWWIVKSLATPRIRAWALTALGLFVSIPIMGGTVALILTYDVVALVSDPSPQGVTRYWYAFLLLQLIPLFIAGVLTCASMLAWFATFRGVRSRFESGELRPLSPSIAPVTISSTVQAGVRTLVNVVNRTPRPPG